MTALRERLRTVTLPDGRRALVIDCEIADAAPAQVKEGLSRRAIVNSGGDCPCGATFPHLSRAQRRHLKPGTVTHVVIEHEADCPAETELLVALIREWEAS
jgi:hypothetical protein